MKNKDQSTFESELKYSMRYYGMLFPSSEEEVKIFEKLYGPTDVEMPDHLKDPKFLLSQKKSQMAVSDKPIEVANLAYAARDENDIPDHVRKKMRKNRKAAEKRMKGNDKT